jgi:hypothetical protein
MMHDDPWHIDWNRVRRGLIPWTAEGYMEVMKFRHKLNDIPKDDWDLMPRRFLVEFNEGAVHVLRLNPLTYESQIALFVHKRYSEAGLTMAAAHFRRFVEINWSLQKHHTCFEGEGLIRKCDEPGKIEVDDCLVQALAEARFTRSRGTGTHKIPTFDLGAIIGRTRELVSQEKQGEE